MPLSEALRWRCIAFHRRALSIRARASPCLSLQLKTRLSSRFSSCSHFVYPEAQDDVSAAQRDNQPPARPAAGTRLSAFFSAPTHSLMAALEAGAASLELVGTHHAMGAIAPINASRSASAAQSLSPEAAFYDSGTFSSIDYPSSGWASSADADSLASACATPSGAVAGSLFLPLPPAGEQLEDKEAEPVAAKPEGKKYKRVSFFIPSRQTGARVPLLRLAQPQPTNAAPQATSSMPTSGHRRFPASPRAGVSAAASNAPRRFTTSLRIVNNKPAPGRPRHATTSPRANGGNPRAGGALRISASPRRGNAPSSHVIKPAPGPYTHRRHTTSPRDAAASSGQGVARPAAHRASPRNVPSRPAAGLYTPRRATTSPRGSRKAAVDTPRRFTIYPRTGVTKVVAPQAARLMGTLRCGSNNAALSNVILRSLMRSSELSRD